MRGWKPYSLLVVLLLGGCAAEPLPDEEQAQEEQQQSGAQLSLEMEEVTPPPQTGTSAPLDPGAAVTQSTGGKPQPDPWRGQAATRGPTKPQPDPWNPVETVQHQHSTNK